jgi:HK97 family phage portal protein
LKFPFFKKSVRFSELLPVWKTKEEIGYATWNEWSTERAIKYGYKVNSYVFACINAIATAASSIPWETYKKVGYKKWEVVENHPLTQLMERPNPYMSTKDLIERMTMHMYLGGNSILTKVKGMGRVTELWTLPPDAIKIVPSRQDFIEAYVYDRDGVKMRFDAKDIIHNKFNDPANPYWGMSPLQAGAKIVDTDTEAQEYNKIALENRAVSDGVFSFEHPLTKEQWTEARQMIREQHQGIKNHRSPWVLGAGATWQSMSMTPAEMDFLESRKLTREEICSIFGVPPVMIGVYENATLANIETARKIFWQDTVLPFMDSIKGCLNLQLANEFGDFYLDYDLSNVEALQENMQDKIANAKGLWSMGVPFNDINQRLELGFDVVEGGEISYLPTSVTTAEQIVNPPEPVQQNAFGNGAGDPPKPPEPKKSVSVAEWGIKSLNLKSAERKESYLNQLEKRRTAWVVSLTHRLGELFDQEGLAVSRAVRANEPKTEKQIEDCVDAAIDYKAWEKFFDSTWTEITKEFGSQVFNELKAGQGPSETKIFGITRIIRDYIVSKTAEKVVGVADFTKQMIKSVVTKAYEDNENSDFIAKQIRGQYAEFSDYRAYRIARTETTAASNFGSISGAKATGLEPKKQWIAAMDSRTRHSHAAMHDQEVGVNEKFSNGMDYPGEYGHGGDSINCRCVLGYSTDDEGDDD